MLNLSFRMLFIGITKLLIEVIRAVLLIRSIFYSQETVENTKEEGIS